MSDADTIPIECTGCGAKLRVPSSKASQRMPCPKCKKLIDVPDEDELKRKEVNIDLVEEPKPVAALSVVCECGAQIRYKEEQRGKKLRCPKCKSVVDVPLEPEPPPPSDGPPSDDPSWEPAPPSKMTPMDWVPFLAASAFVLLSAFSIGPLVPFVFAAKLPQSLGVAFASMGTIVLGVVAAIQAGCCIVALSYLLRVDAARILIMVVSGVMILLNIVAAIGGITLLIVINLLIYGSMFFAFRGEPAVRYVSGGGIPPKLSMGLTGGVALLALILGFIGYSGSAHLLEQFAGFDTMMASIDKAKGVVAGADPANEKEKRAAVQEATRTAETAEREADGLRELVGDRSHRLLMLRAAHLRLETHKLVPLTPSALSSLKSRIRSDVSAARAIAAQDEDRRGAGEMVRIADLLEEELRTLGEQK